MQAEANSNRVGRRLKRKKGQKFRKSAQVTIFSQALSWIVVKDVKAAIAYYTEVVGLKLMEFNEQYGWAELEGYEGGSRLGIAQVNPQDNMAEGQNAVVTFTVENLDAAKQEMVEKGAKCEGDVLEVPGHVKMQTVIDADGNRFQICEVLHSYTC